ncbi:uncharacterized protein UV8b_00283 [Ustilaginoidea virens]|uniref:Uncharacterized protein n=1 Tax=Ustilaginoidea virens TaxID=1159556 RepID=A0A8E5ME74_USTVR|nr:uncharacterized protein UV8b_00283 [Ustilaginoidea virens]QUC16042.1 hypothetical protein UV8b_00283 [Ustilaginoidea virens]
MRHEASVGGADQGRPGDAYMGTWEHGNMGTWESLVAKPRDMFSQIHVNTYVDVVTRAKGTPKDFSLVLNEDVAKAGIQFTLRDIMSRSQPDWAIGAYELEKKKAPSSGILPGRQDAFCGPGVEFRHCSRIFSTAPMRINSTSREDVVVVAAGTMGSSTNYTEGKTATHESVATKGLSSERGQGHSCPDKPGLDTIHNFMDYSYE